MDLSKMLRAVLILPQYVPNDRSSPSDTHNSKSQQTSQTLTMSRTSSDLTSFHAPDPREVFEAAIKDFKTHLDPDELDNLRTTSNLKIELKKIEDKQGDEGKLQAFRRIKDFIDKIDWLGVVIDSIIGTNDIKGLVWGSVKFLFNIAKENPEHINALLMAYQRLGDVLPSLENPSGVFTCHSGLQSVLARLVADLMEFHQKAIRLFTGRALKIIFKPHWQSFSPTFDHIVSRVKSHRALIDDKTWATPINTAYYYQDMREIREYMQKIEKQILDLRYAELTGAETNTKHKNICHDRAPYPNSGDWILRHPKVKHWLITNPDEPSKPILWVNGRPGTGKTYLASVLIENCKKDLGSITSYFYCNQTLGTNNYAITVLRDILLQLIYHHRESTVTALRFRTDFPENAIGSETRALKLRSHLDHRPIKLYDLRHERLQFPRPAGRSSAHASPPTPDQAWGLEAAMNPQRAQTPGNPSLWYHLRELKMLNKRNSFLADQAANLVMIFRRLYACHSSATQGFSPAKRAKCHTRPAYHVEPANLNATTVIPVVVAARITMWSVSTKKERPRPTKDGTQGVLRGMQGLEDRLSSKLADLQSMQLKFSIQSPNGYVFLLERPKATESMQKALSMNLEDWRSSLPEFMRWRYADPPWKDINVTRMRAKYYGARYVIHHPALYHALLHYPSYPTPASSSPEPDRTEDDTEAFDGIKGRPIVTDIFGTADACVKK
ncbi:hypothetical protein FE257_003841 [Aspergillus nanangensis]|uniref:NACHT domain-containing protein n=1 Tax=Aspergillus nanangensis TaxID=2582783 RepID=A0AAD4GML1_ASPNN|nr:hypothetical protein FE257_003841 [Aspergillus nanangensis]